MMSHTVFRSVALACGFVIVGYPAAAVADQTPQGVTRAESAPASLERSAMPDPRLLDAVLRKHVHEGRVDYAALQKDSEARKRLRAFLAAVATMPEEAPLAAWLNAYNALVIQFVLERYPISSVKAVDGFFTQLERTVAGKPRSLDDIEHGVIRPRFRDARVHVALNCGAVSCPPLRPRAFRQSTLDADLDALARRVVRDPRHVQLRDGRLRLSAIFFWFEEDFVRAAGSVVAWLKRYGDRSTFGSLPPDIDRVQRDYDWALADAKSAR